MAHEYQSMNQPDSALLYAKKAYEVIKGAGQNSYISIVLGDAYAGKANYELKLEIERRARTAADTCT